ncbi:flagellar protein FlgN [Yoonia sp.]|uniref:flagellar protein FlgN n=1 Tax=Yoonia sp. TaxID=2212373 RepID=UPI003974CCED
MPDQPLAQFHQLLELEKKALISADFEQLGGFLQQKEELLEQLARAKPAKHLLRPIRAKMDENQSLLAAAIKGVAAAGERLEALQNVQNGLRVYDPSGRVDLVQNRHHSLEKKA